MTDLLTRATFEPHHNTAFRLDLGEAEPLSLILVEVVDRTPEGFAGEQFSLLFAGPPEPYLEQGTYSLDHEALGTVALFLVPVDQRKDGFRYEAFFNLAAPDADDD